MSDDKKRDTAGDEIRRIINGAKMGLDMATGQIREAKGALDLALEQVANVERGRPLTRRERILVSLAGETRSASYLRDDTGIGASALDAELALMIEDGLVVKRGKGQYQKEIAF